MFSIPESLKLEYFRLWISRFGGKTSGTELARLWEESSVEELQISSDTSWSMCLQASPSVSVCCRQWIWRSSQLCPWSPHQHVLYCFVIKHTLTSYSWARHCTKLIHVAGAFSAPASNSLPEIPHQQPPRGSSQVIGLGFWWIWRQPPGGQFLLNVANLINLAFGRLSGTWEKLGDLCSLLRGITVVAVHRASSPGLNRTSCWALNHYLHFPP